MYYNGIKEVGAAKASIFINVMPVSAVFMATLFLGETFKAGHAIGATLVLTGVYIGTNPKLFKRKSEAELAKNEIA
jgi:drug/metabolite transporter (DMT)-like permease